MGSVSIDLLCSRRNKPHRPLRPRQPRAQLSAAPDHIPQRPLEILHPQLVPAPLQHRLRRAAVEFLDERGAYLADALADGADRCVRQFQPAGVAREEDAAFAVFGQADLDGLVDAPGAAGERLRVRREAKGVALDQRADGRSVMPTSAGP